jgi:DNA-binding CsgD family transcriptional regulator
VAAVRIESEVVATANRSPSACQAPDLEELVYALVEHTALNRQDDDETGVVLDVTVAGVRCLLIRQDETGPTVALSPREQEIARMVGDGLTNKAIAQVLEISLWTVSTHLRRIFAKLNVSTRAAMVAQLLSEPRSGSAISAG